MTMTDCGGRYMAAEAAFNGVGAGPYAAMFAAQLTVNGAALTRAPFSDVLAANVASVMRFRTAALSPFGAILIV